MPLGCVTEDALSSTPVLYSYGYDFREHTPIIEGPITQELLVNLKVTDLFVTDEAVSVTRRQEITQIAVDAGIELFFMLSSTPSVLGNRMKYCLLDGVLIGSTGSIAPTRLTYVLSKRALDISVALLALIMTLPVSFVIAVAIAFTSPGPILFAQQRVGSQGQLFSMLKFRTMYASAARYERSPEAPNDSRITLVGRYLRRTSLDELPQLLNVLRGDMSLVGPRPEMPFVVSSYDAICRERLSVPQGITGMWQLSADRRHVIHDNIEYDRYYIEHRSMFLDLAILLHTAIFAMRGI